MAVENKVLSGQKVLSKNDEIAAVLRDDFKKHRVLVFNLVSSPGSGKTTLLEKTITTLKDKINLAIIAGDVQTENDADRLIKAGCDKVVPIVTGGACHLDAAMVQKALEHLDLKTIDLLFIENVGNLVCPAGYDLGEDMKIALVSTPEGDDKPSKYPTMFRRSSVLVLNKLDLLGTSDFDLQRFKTNVFKIRADMKTFDMSCRSGQGLDNWFTWLINRVASRKSGG